MTSLECTLLITNLFTLLPLYILIKDNRKLEKANEDLRVNTLKFSKDTLKQIDKLLVALDNCIQAKIDIMKTLKDEKTTTTK